MRRNFNHQYTSGFCHLVLIKFIYVGAYTHIPIDVAFKLTNSIKTLLSSNHFMRIIIVHTYDNATAALIAKRGNISKNTTTTILWSVFPGTIIRHIPVFTFFELYVVFRLTHLFKLFYRISGHLSII